MHGLDGCNRPMDEWMRALKLHTTITGDHVPHPPAPSPKHITLPSTPNPPNTPTPPHAHTPTPGAPHLARVVLQQLHALVAVVLGLDAVADARHALAALLQPLHKVHWGQAPRHGILEAPGGRGAGRWRGGRMGREEQEEGEGGAGGGRGEVGSLMRRAGIRGKSCRARLARVEG